MKMGRAGPPFVPRRRPQAGKSGDPRSQNVDRGICRSHIGSRALADKACRQGFFWPTALQDATTLVTRCEACQFHSKKLHQPAQALQTIPLSWPFSVWGLDILGPFPKAVGGFVLGNVAEIQNFPTCHQDLSMEKPSTRGRRVHLHTLVDR